jgi:group II intron reverse transcriptase/maturase
MRPKEAWGRVKSPTKGTGLGQPKDVFSRKQAGYSMWTEAMKAAIGQLRRAGRKWYALYDKVIAPANLEAAWDRTDRRVTGKKRRGGAGVDGVTVAKFADRAEGELGRLGEQLATGRYNPSPVRRHYIPKAGSVKLRPLRLPTVRDKVVQEACRSMIEPIFEAEFLASSHGFRPGRSVDTACAQVEQYLSMGKEWVVDVDIEKCYDTIPHEPLIDRVDRRISDGRVLGLIRSFLQSGVMAEMEIRYETTGTPQGGIISPVLANIFLPDLDMALEKRGTAWVRYADDVVALCQSREEAEQVLETIRATLSGLGLRASPPAFSQLETEHPESRMRENRPYGSEGGASNDRPYPYFLPALRAWFVPRSESGINEGGCHETSCVNTRSADHAARMCAGAIGAVRSSSIRTWDAGPQQYRPEWISSHSAG